MRIWLPILGAATMLAATGMIVSAVRAQTAKAAPAAATKDAHSFYDFKMTRIDGKPMPMSAYKGKVVLLVNTASFCGLTPQYEALQKLQTTLGPKGFTVIGVPSGDFMGQEYDDNGKIKEFCDTKFGITFPLTEKASVKGPNAAPVYKWAKAELATDNESKWNFHKFLIGKDGQLIAGFGSKLTPDSPEVTSAIEKALKA
ncbi:glutathione peroxidase [Sandaracinobacteroides hominis]|uniref:glutathione peroxidase n=1 Tax=Sandaracinobacteroides hominis TaxID=2780086 RepID=UPI001F1ACA14|nr:redoxin domain-containing protein [Sandaracinobacteroides hominis]